MPLDQAVRNLRIAAATERENGNLSAAGNHYFNAANLLSTVEKDDQALVPLMQAQARARECSDFDLLAACLGLKAKIYTRGEQYKEALSALQEAEELDREMESSNLEITLEQQFGVLEELGDTVGMRATAERFFAVAKDEQAIWRIRRHLTRFGINLGEEAAEAHPYDMSTLVPDFLEKDDSARAAQIQGLFDEAIALKDYDPATALQKLVLATEIRGSGPTIWMWRGILETQSGMTEESIKSFDQSLAKSDTSEGTWMLKAGSCAALGRYEEEVECCARAYAIKPDYAEAYSMRAAALIALSRFREAVLDATRAVELKPTYGPGLMNLGSALMGLGVWNEAINAFSLAAKLGVPRANEAVEHCRRNAAKA
jgi:tetratricopeptide (TPR) repeat protein